MIISYHSLPLPACGFSLHIGVKVSLRTMICKAPHVICRPCLHPAVPGLALGKSPRLPYCLLLAISGTYEVCFHPRVLKLWLHRKLPPNHSKLFLVWFIVESHLLRKASLTCASEAYPTFPSASISLLCVIFVLTLSSIRS